MPKPAVWNLKKIDNFNIDMPQSEFETIAWTKKPSWEEFRADIDKIILDMMNCL